MLEKITLRNFQPHRKRSFQISPLTCFVGKSDAGKSAILRALRWLFYNKPRGSGFQTRGTKFVRVEAVIDGKTVSRKKGKSSGYFLNGKPFRAVKTDVPPQIAKLLNVTEANFQRQHDAPFWFSLSAGQVSKELNQIINLQVIDQSLHSVGQQARTAATQKEFIKKRKNEAKAKKKELLWVPQMMRELGEISALHERLCLLEGAEESLSELLDKVKDKEKKVKRLTAMSEELQEILKQGEKYFDLRRKEEQLADIILGLRDQEHLKCRRLKQQKEIKLAIKKLPKPKTCPICGKEMSSQ